MAKIKEIMETDAYLCHFSATVGEVLEHLAVKKVSGVPVVDDQKKVVGFISDGDIMKYIAKKKPRIINWVDHMPVLYDNESLEEKLAGLLNKSVMDLATRRVIAADVDQEIDEVAEILGQKRIKKVPVLEKGIVVGVVSRSEIIRYIVQMMLPER